MRTLRIALAFAAAAGVVPFKGNRLSYHRGSASGNEEKWLELRREQGGRVISGWARSAPATPASR